MKNFFAEFKKFITRGNVVDMAVGVIVGSSFTAIVNGLSNNVLKPMINWLLVLVFGKDSLNEVYTVLNGVYDETGKLILAESVYIDWGAFINTIINFFLIALVLFIIVKIMNRTRERHKRIAADILDDIPTREDRKNMKKLGIKLSDRDAVKDYLREKARKAEEILGKSLDDRSAYSSRASCNKHTLTQELGIFCKFISHIRPP